VGKAPFKVGFFGETSCLSRKPQSEYELDEYLDNFVLVAKFQPNSSNRDEVLTEVCEKLYEKVTFSDIEIGIVQGEPDVVYKKFDKALKPMYLYKLSRREPVRRVKSTDVYKHLKTMTGAKYVQLLSFKVRGQSAAPG
jgi:hypothetical protein